MLHFPVIKLIVKLYSEFQYQFIKRLFLIQNTDDILYSMSCILCEAKQLIVIITFINSFFSIDTLHQLLRFAVVALSQSPYFRIVWIQHTVY